MGKKAKLLQKLRQNPKNIRFDDIDKLLLGLGFDKRQRGSSHAVYTISGQPPLTIPYRKPFLLPVYVKQVLALLDELLEDDNEL